MQINLGSKIRIIRDCEFYSEGETGTVVSIVSENDEPEVEVEFDDAGYNPTDEYGNSTWWVLVDDLKVI